MDGKKLVQNLFYQDVSTGMKCGKFELPKENEGILNPGTHCGIPTDHLRTTQRVVGKMII